ncbi:LysR family transcriptional regulator [Aeromicrobium sp. REDSEA-S32_B7]|uniref:helix-turn-helix domain-containing protein n=1 Tax=Aeromicrobium sp. REDSEA-S32_B7 TaxID=1811526 RepID=UPI000B0D4FD5|nr:LysR family transcriptional regulator [Aeromicrobium sp. REDSEA-S32_B7]
MHLDLRMLRALVAVDQIGSFTDAARVLRFSTPAVSAQVQALDGQTLTIALVNAGARDSFVASGSAEYVQQALQQVIGVQWRIEAIVDPSVDPRAASTPQPSAPAAQQAAPAPSGQGRGVGAPEAVRQAMREPGSVAPPEDPDLAAHPDDPVVDQGADPEQLLSRELGARVIDEIDHG